MLNINKLRKEYQNDTLDIQQLDANPFLQFYQWFETAKSAQVLEPNAMSLATCSHQGYPSCRTVLLKEMDDQGFVFFTNYNSRKAQDLADHPFACLTFHWRELERQVILRGKVEKLTRLESEAYFKIRPRGSQIGAWASSQDQVLPSREILDSAYDFYQQKYLNQEIPTPPYWGGYRLIPHYFEFWQGRANRLHDRFSYTLKIDKWSIQRLAP